MDARPSFSNGGKISRLNIKEGDRVTQGMVLAQMETDSLELALSQARVAEAQAQVALTQAQTTLNQMQLAQTQAESALTSAQFNLDRTQAVSDIKDDITKLEWQITNAEMLVRDALVRNDLEGAQYWKVEQANYQMELGKQQQKLTELLAKDEYAGIAVYEIQGEKYDRLVVEDVRLKQQQVLIAQQTIDQAKLNVQQADQTITQAARALAQTQNNIEFTQKQINEATIIAPFTGIIASLDAKEGDFVASPGVSSGTVIYMVDPHSLEISTEVDEIDVARILDNQKTLINLDALPGSQICRVRSTPFQYRR